MGVKEEKKVRLKSKGSFASIDYARLTFILSVLGFLGSVGFYFGVLREVYSPIRDKQKIEVLERQVDVLTKAIANNNDNQIK